MGMNNGRARIPIKKRARTETGAVLGGFALAGPASQTPFSIQLRFYIRRFRAHAQLGIRPTSTRERAERRRNWSHTAQRERENKGKMLMRMVKYTFGRRSLHNPSLSPSLPIVAAFAAVGAANFGTSTSSPAGQTDGRTDPPFLLVLLLLPFHFPCMRRDI